MQKELKEELYLIYPPKFLLFKRMKHFFSNSTIFVSLILFITIVCIYYIIYISYSTLSPISALVGTSFLTVLVLIIRDSYSTMNKKDKIYLSFNNELKRNWVNLRDNSNRAVREIGYINDNGGTVNNPLFKLQFDVYDLMLQNFPEEIIRDLTEMEGYIHKSHEINEIIKFREELPKHSSFSNNYPEYLKTLKIIDELIINQSKGLFGIIIKLLEKNGRIIQVESIEEIKKLTDTEYLTKFLESNKIKKVFTVDQFKKSCKMDVSKIYIHIFKGY